MPYVQQHCTNQHFSDHLQGRAYLYVCVRVLVCVCVCLCVCAFTLCSKHSHSWPYCGRCYIAQRTYNSAHSMNILKLAMASFNRIRPLTTHLSNSCKVSHPSMMHLFIMYHAWKPRYYAFRLKGSKSYSVLESIGSAEDALLQAPEACFWGQFGQYCMLPTILAVFLSL